MQVYTKEEQPSFRMRNNTNPDRYRQTPQWVNLGQPYLSNNCAFSQASPTHRPWYLILAHWVLAWYAFHALLLYLSASDLGSAAVMIPRPTITISVPLMPINFAGVLYC